MNGLTVPQVKIPSKMYRNVKPVSCGEKNICNYYERALKPPNHVELVDLVCQMSSLIL